MTRKGFLAFAAGIAATLATSRTALADGQNKDYHREEEESLRNIKHVHAALEQLIDQLNHDRHDYGGYRDRAIEAMRHARENLDRAIQWDEKHSH